MAQIYFSKFNINSEIYDVYKDLNLREKILKDVVLAMSTEQTIPCPDENKDFKIKFCDLDKQWEKGYVIGRLVKIGEKEQEEYIPAKDTVDTTVTKNGATSATFYFDVNSEIIAFITRNELGYRQFNQYFKWLIEDSVENAEFELFLENNIDELQSQIKTFQSVSKVSLTLIPPNSTNDQDFKRLFGCGANDIQESGITKITQTAVGSIKKGLNITSGWFERMIKFGVGFGYGDIAVEGKDHRGNKRVLTSNDDTPFKRTIREEEKHNLSEFQENARAGIVELKAQKQRLRDDDERQAETIND